MDNTPARRTAARTRPETPPTHPEHANPEHARPDDDVESLPKGYPNSDRYRAETVHHPETHQPEKPARQPAASDRVDER